ncbi:hypothetical protein SDC9_113238 [bioreactor metagenome]|uniref:Endoribonuclease YicC-like C-terminal domain-containing protein n=1 Tax=bioreactor metagenome TaxID=1076179 RepID=A0A645BP27_9ZZZZ
MRKTGGETLFKDLKNRAQVILDYVGMIEKRSPEVNAQYAAKLKSNIEQLLNGVEIDESRLLTEVAIFADKGAIDEEIVRLKSHMSQFMDLIKQDNPVGRKIDFLVQEMNREANTMGSKSSDVEITKIVVEIKSEIEKIREQIQNIE